MSIYRNNLRISQTGLGLIKRFEAVRLSPYQDIAGKWTIGYGHLMTPYEVRHPRTILMLEALQMLAFDVRNYELFVNSCVRVPITQYQFDALVSLCYNIGCGNFETSTLLRILNAGDIAGAANEFVRWNKYTNPKTGLKKEARGLTNRRMQERELFKQDFVFVQNVGNFPKPAPPAEKPSIFSGLKQWLIGDLK